MDLSDAVTGWPDSSGSNQSGGGSQWPGQPATNPSWPPQPGQPATNPPWHPQPGQPATNPSWPPQPGQPATNPSWPPQPGQPGQPATNPSWPPQPGQPAVNPWPESGGGHQPSPQPHGPGGWSNPAPAPTPNFPVAPQQSLKVPHLQSLPKGVFDKLLITIAGTINSNPSKITVDLCEGRDIAFHITARFNEDGKRVIVRNSRIRDRWGKEEREVPRFPFTPGRPFEMKILCTNSGYRVAVDGTHLFEFQHRIRDLKSINSFNIHEDLTLSKVLVETIR